VIDKKINLHNNKNKNKKYYKFIGDKKIKKCIKGLFLFYKITPYRIKIKNQSYYNYKYEKIIQERYYKIKLFFTIIITIIINYWFM